MVANVVGIAAVYFIYKGFCLFNGSQETWRRHIWPAAIASLAIIYYSHWQDDVLLRTLVMTVCVLIYALLIGQNCWLNRTNGQRIACRLFTLLFFSFSLLGLLRLGVWLFLPEQRGLYQSSAANVVFFLLFIVMLIGMAFLLMLMNGLRVSQELEMEKGIGLLGRQELVESQQQLRRAIQFAPFPLMVHAEGGGVIQLSEAWTEITGYELADIPTTKAWINRAYGERQDEFLQTYIMWTNKQAVAMENTRENVLYVRLDFG